MQRDLMARWLRLQRKDPDTADRIRNLATAVAPLLHNQKPDVQVGLLETNEEFRELNQLLRENKESLRIQDSGYAYVAFILGLGYCTVMKTDGKRAS